MNHLVQQYRCRAARNSAYHSREKRRPRPVSNRHRIKNYQQSANDSCERIEDGKPEKSRKATDTIEQRSPPRRSQSNMDAVRRLWIVVVSRLTHRLTSAATRAP